MTGTRYCVTSAIRLIPPNTTSAVTAHSTSPLIHGSTPNAFFAASATELAWTILPMPNAAAAVRNAKTVPNQRILRPFDNTYIAPPRTVPLSSSSR